MESKELVVLRYIGAVSPIMYICISNAGFLLTRISSQGSSLYCNWRRKATVAVGTGATIIKKSTGAPAIYLKAKVVAHPDWGTRLHLGWGCAAQTLKLRPPFKPENPGSFLFSISD